MMENVLQLKHCHRIKCEAVDSERFHDITDTWIRRPQVVNRKLAGAVITNQFCIPRSRANEAPSIALTGSGEESCSNFDNDIVYCTVRKLLPRAQHVSTLREVVIKDDKNFSVTFLPLENSGRLFPYCLQFCPQTSELVLRWCNCVQQPCCHENEDSSDNLALILDPHSSDHILEPTCGINIITLPWLVHILLPKLASWAESWDEGRTKRESLIPLEHYVQLYQIMKKKYAAPLIEMWTEVTDPMKYVYEDIAIATYLIVLWQQEREREGLKEKQSFVDLGCGNGLLVYLLTMEGYPGVGIDVRRRKIWDKYGPEVCLKLVITCVSDQEEVVVPSEATRYPHCDWIVGNHSDELTPWLPLVAARSSYTTRYFSIPCCFHDFDGKFCRSDPTLNPTLSQYESYLQYTKTIGKEMGFVVYEDRLRIPSSKKICQIGMKRTYLPAEEAAVDKKRKEFLQAHCHKAHSSGNNSGPRDTGDERWAEKFSPRSSVEPVKNCTLVKKDIQEEIVHNLTCVLLQIQNFVDSEKGGLWNAGGRISIKEAAKLINSRLLTQLKQEHGGLQTLFRNHHQVFIARDGYVQLRDWSKRDDTTDGSSICSRKRSNPSQRQLLHKTRLCWFHAHHPQGCPRLECCYAHGLEDLATRPQFPHAKPKK